MGSVEDSFSIDWVGAEGWFRVDTNALYFFYFLVYVNGTIWDNINILPAYADLTKEIHRPLSF